MVKTNLEQTIQAILTRGKKLNGSMHMKMEGSSYEGFMYEICDEQNNLRFNVDIRLSEKHGGFIFEMHPGIHVIHPKYVPAVAKYIQTNVKTRFGNIKAGGDHRNIEYHAESFFKEHPISVETIELYEAEGMRCLAIHYDNLKKLATGKYEITPVDSNTFLGGDEDYKYDQQANIDSIERYLRVAGHNAICKRIDENNHCVFYSQVMMETASFRFKYFLEESGVLTVWGSTGEKEMIIPEEYAYAVSEFLDRENSKHMFCALWTGNQTEGFHGCVSTSMLDGVVGADTLETLNNILLKLLTETNEKVEMLSAGMLLTEDNDEFDELFKKMMEADTGRLSSENGQGAFPGLFGDLSAMLNDIEKNCAAKGIETVDDGVASLGVGLPELDTNDEISMDDYAEGFTDDNNGRLGE